MFGDCHVHLMMDGENYKAAASLHGDAVNEAALRAHLAAYRDAGVRFLRDGGDRYGVSAAAKKLAPEYGIDYRTPIFAIHKKGHYGGIVGLPFSDPDGYRALVLRAKAEGADFIKIMISGILDFSEFGKMTENGLDEADIREMIGTAHAEGMAVMAHANGDAAVRAAIDAGVDTIEHGNYQSDGTLELLARSDTVWIPTLAPIGNLIGCGRFPDESLRKILSCQMRNVRYAFERGAHIGLGSDAGAYLVPHGRGALDEYEYLKRAIGEKNEGFLDERLMESESIIKEKTVKRHRTRS